MRTGIIRAAHHARLDVPDWPDPARAHDGWADAWRGWLAAVWSVEPVAQALDHASPTLAQQVRAVLPPAAALDKDVRRAGMSVARYLRRLRGRPTPLGLFAGVAGVRFAERPHVWWGTDHRAVARPDAGWLDTVIADVHSDPRLFSRLTVMVNTSLIARGNRIVVPHQAPVTDRPGPEPAPTVAAVDVSIRYTRAVAAAFDAARTPTRGSRIIEAVTDVFPHIDPARITALLSELVARRALVTSLHPPSTETDPLTHLIRELTNAGGPCLTKVGDLAEIAVLLSQHHRMPAAQSGPTRAAAAHRMRQLAPPGAGTPSPSTCGSTRTSRCLTASPATRNAPRSCWHG